MKTLPTKKIISRAVADIYQQSLDLHKKHHGKIEINSKVPLVDQDDLSRAYTPGVAEVCRIVAGDVSLAREYTIKKNTVAVVSDGSAVLGLGNIGPHGALPVMEGKAVLFKEFAGVDAFPICVNTQDTEEIIALVKNISPVFGGINLEDISAPRCFEILERLQNELDIPVMHDDQQGTATVTLAGLINALDIAGKRKENARVVISGVGAAGVAIVRLLKKYGFVDITVVDSNGIVHKNRKDLNSVKRQLAEITNLKNQVGGISEALKNADVFIGVSVAGIVTENMIKSMSTKPIVFAMANPVPEIMPDDAKKAGAYIVATGRSDFPNQVNNVLAFPGIFRGVLDNNIMQITDDMLIRSAEALASFSDNPDVEHILPNTLDKRVAETVADAIRSV